MGNRETLAEQAKMAVKVLRVTEVHPDSKALKGQPETLAFQDRLVLLDFQVCPVVLDLQEVRALQVQLGQLVTRELQVLQETQETKVSRVLADRQDLLAKLGFLVQQEQLVILVTKEALASQEV